MDSPPRDDLYRGVFPFELRSESSPRQGFLGYTMVGHFVVWNRWAEVDSRLEGHFMERAAPGACNKTFAENRSTMRVLFNHGKDTVGQKVLGPIEELRDDGTGGYYEVPLLDTTYNRDLLPALENGLYGASFRFDSFKEAYNHRAKPSAYNPKGLPERTLTELRLKEFGPVTFPVYQDATAGILCRSLTDEFTLMRLGETMNERAANKEPYGDVEYADPGYQSDGKKRYPVDTEEHVHAALSYIGKAHNAAQYTAEQLAHIKSVIHAAAKKFGIQVSSDTSNSADGRSDAGVDTERNADGTLLRDPQPERQAPPSPVVAPSRLVIVKNPAKAVS